MRKVLGALLALSLLAAGCGGSQAVLPISPFGNSGGGGGNGNGGNGNGGGGNNAANSTVNAKVTFPGSVKAATISFFDANLTQISTQSLGAGSVKLPVSAGVVYYLISGTGVRPQWGAIDLQPNVNVNTEFDITGTNDPPSPQETDAEALAAVHMARAAMGIRGIPALAQLALGLGNKSFAPVGHGFQVQRFDLPVAGMSQAGPRGWRVVPSARFAPVPFPTANIQVTGATNQPAVDVHGNVWIETQTDILDEFANNAGTNVNPTPTPLASVNIAPAPQGNVQPVGGLVIDSRNGLASTNNVWALPHTERGVALLPGGAGSAVVEQPANTGEFISGVATLPGGDFIGSDIDSTTNQSIQVVDNNGPHNIGFLTFSSSLNGEFPALDGFAVASDGSVLVLTSEAPNSGIYSQVHVHVITINSTSGVPTSLTQTLDDPNLTGTIGQPVENGVQLAPFIKADRTRPNQFIASGVTGVVRLVFTPAAQGGPSITAVPVTTSGVGFCVDGDADGLGNIWLADHDNKQAVRIGADGSNPVVEAGVNATGATVDQNDNAWFGTAAGLTRVAVGTAVLKGQLPDGSTLTTSTSGGITTVTQTFANGTTNVITFPAQTNGTSSTVNTTSNAFFGGTQGQIQLTLNTATHVLTAVSSAFGAFDGVTCSATTTVNQDGSMTVNGNLEDVIAGAANPVIVSPFTATVSAPDANGKVTESITITNPTYGGLTGTVVVNASYDGQGNLTAFTVTDAARNMTIAGGFGGGVAAQNNQFQVTVSGNGTAASTATDDSLVDALISATNASPTAPAVLVPPPANGPPLNTNTGDNITTANLVDVVGATTDTITATVVNQGQDANGNFVGGTGDSASLDAGLGSGIVADSGSTGGSPPVDPVRRH
ncbi:MAG: beta strand repeat-containing protein [Candidatus Xenobia bacterium]